MGVLRSVQQKNDSFQLLRALLSRVIAGWSAI